MALGLSYRQCVQEFQAMRTQLELKQEECKQTEINLKNAFDVKIQELIATQREEVLTLKDRHNGELEALQERHYLDREDLKVEYEQEDDR